MPVAIITGSNTGLGFETARGLMAKGFEVVLTSRDSAKGERAVEKLRNEFPSGVCSVLSLDLARTESIKKFPASFSKAHGQWDVLINNAGAKVLSKYSETDSGVEYHFGVNAVGHFHLTKELLPFRASRCRIVSVSSIVARFAPKAMGPAGSKNSYSPGASYAASKLSNLLFALELNKRFGTGGLLSVAAHPGFARAEPYGPKSTRFFESFLAQSAAQGARPIIEAASRPNLTGGSYLAPKYLELWGDFATGKIPASCTEENQDENWKILEKLSGTELVL